MGALLRRLFCTAFAITTCGFVLHAQDITTKDLLAGLSNPSRWLTHSGDYAGHRFSLLTEITAANVEQLAAQWAFQTGVVNKFEATPIVVDGTLYVTGALNHAWAIDGRTGRQLWHYQRTLPDGLKVCCGMVNRGFAVYHDRLFMVTLDAHFVALEAKTGKVIYDIEMATVPDGFAGTGAPLVVNDKVIVGIAGGEFANRGFIDAYDPTTGQRIWRFYTIPAPGEPGSESWQGDDVWQRGGGPTWLTGTYDPAANLLYWGTGNPNPDWNGETRPGDNLYTDALLALDPDTGKLRWHFQFTPHDTHDWDANEIPVLADLTVNGRPRKAVMLANRNGFFYVLDRLTGEFLLGKPFVNTTWAREIGPDGKPKLLPNQEPTEAGTVTCPDWYGGTNFMSPSYDASRGLFFLTARETCARFLSRSSATGKLGDRTMGGTVQIVPEPKRAGALRAIDPTTGELKWEIAYDDAGWAGVLATAGGVVFSGDHQGTFFAADSKTGRKLFQFQTGAPIFAPPTSYAIDGRQYVVIPSGSTLTAFSLPAKPRT